MADEFQSLQLVNGEWVSTNVDIYRSLARARQQEDVDMHEPDSKSQPLVPRLGILSKTVIASSYVKFILPANIRHKKCNDVVFISENAVHLKEVRAKGPLRHIASKTDIKGRILAARVFGEPRKVVVKAEHGTPIKRRDVHAQRRSTAGEEADILPPEILVLTTDRRALIFVWAVQPPSSKVHFRQKAVRLPFANSRSDRIGSFLAVDPMCRAIATAATEGQFILYKTKRLEKWREDVRLGHDSLPIEDERIISIEGCILHMEFLSPGPDPDDPHVVLVFVLSHNGQTKVSCYEWDTRFDLKAATARVQLLPVSYEDFNPSLLIPLSRSPDFLLVSDRHISSCRNILSGTIQPEFVPLDFPPLRPGEGKSLPHWVQWQKPARNEEFPKEALYIAREDGKVIYAEVPENKLPTINEAGQLPHSIDRAFASVDVDYGALNRVQPDVLVAAGTTSDGCLTKVGSWVTEGHNQQYMDNNTFAVVESISNWAPTTDLCVTRLSRTLVPFERERESIFIANGRSPYGTISELRSGVRAHVRNSCPGMKGCSGLFILDSSSEEVSISGRSATQYRVAVLANISPETLVLRLVRLENAWEMEQIGDEGQEPHDGISREETIAAGIITGQFSVQITHRQARIIARQDFKSIDTQQFPSPILAAAVSSETSSIAIAYREQSKTILAVVAVLEQGSFGSPVFYQLSSDPTCIELMVFDGSSHVFVSTTDSSIQLLKVTPSGLDKKFEMTLRSIIRSSSVSTVCESAVQLSSINQRAIVCGTRDGNLVRLIIADCASGTYSSSIEQTRMGTTSVNVRPCATNVSMAFAACGADFCVVRVVPTTRSRTGIDSIWFTDPDDSNYQQSPISALTQLPLTEHDEDAEVGLAGFLFTISGDRLLLAQIDYDIAGSRSSIPEAIRTVPRTLTVGATPIKLMYIENLRLQIVATTESRQERSYPDAYRSIRTVVKLLKVTPEEVKIEPEEEVNEEQETATVAEYELKHYERVHCILEWIYTDRKSRSHHFIFVGTGITDSSGRESKGRRLFFQVDAKTSALRLKKEKEFHGPVRCMALKDATTLVTAIGKNMFVEHYDYEISKWVKAGSIELPSDAVQISVSGDRVYVSTTQHSHIVYEHTGLEQVAFIKSFSDSRQRQSAHHLALRLDLADSKADELPPSSAMEISTEKQGGASPLSSIVLIADKTCTLAGLYIPTTPWHKSSAPTLFEAHLPRSVTRIERGDIRPPWRHANLPGPLQGVIADDMIGSCSDGTIYNFVILSKAALNLLKFIQNMIELKEDRKSLEDFPVIQHQQTGPAFFNILMNGSSGDQSATSPSPSEAQAALIKARDIDPEVGKPASKFRHVDSDVINRFFDGDVLARSYDEPDSLWGLLTVDTDARVVDRLVELAIELGVANVEDKADKREVVVEKVGLWMHDVLLSVL